MSLILARFQVLLILSFWFRIRSWLLLLFLISHLLLAAFLGVVLWLLGIKSFVGTLLFFFIFVIHICGHLVEVSRKFFLFWGQFAINQTTVLVFKLTNNKVLCLHLPAHLLFHFLLELLVFLFICFVLVVVCRTFVEVVSAANRRDNLIGYLSATILIHL